MPNHIDMVAEAADDVEAADRALQTKPNLC
jgi:hypothetical protein